MLHLCHFETKYIKISSSCSSSKQYGNQEIFKALTAAKTMDPQTFFNFIDLNIDASYERIYHSNTIIPAIVSPKPLSHRLFA